MLTTSANTSTAATAQIPLLPALPPSDAASFFDVMAGCGWTTPAAPSVQPSRQPVANRAHQNDPDPDEVSTQDSDPTQSTGPANLAVMSTMLLALPTPVPPIPVDLSRAVSLPVAVLEQSSTIGRVTTTGNVAPGGTSVAGTEKQQPQTIPDVANDKSSAPVPAVNEQKSATLHSTGPLPEHSQEAIGGNESTAPGLKGGDQGRHAFNKTAAARSATPDHVNDTLKAAGIPTPAHKTVDIAASEVPWPKTSHEVTRQVEAPAMTARRDGNATQLTPAKDAGSSSSDTRGGTGSDPQHSRNSAPVATIAFDTIQPARPDTAPSAAVGAVQSPQTAQVSNRSQVADGQPSIRPDSAPYTQAAVPTGTGQIQASPMRAVIHYQTNSEMKVAMSSEALGPVEIHASIKGDEVSASVTVQRHDTHQVLSSALGNLQDALSTQEIKIDHIHMAPGLDRDSSMNANAGSTGQEQPSQQNSRMPNRGGTDEVSAELISQDPAWTGSEPTRLSLHA